MLEGNGDRETIPAKKTIGNTVRTKNIPIKLIVKRLITK